MVAYNVGSLLGLIISDILVNYYNFINCILPVLIVKLSNFDVV